METSDRNSTLSIRYLSFCSETVKAMLTSSYITECFFHSHLTYGVDLLENSSLSDKVSQKMFKHSKIMPLLSIFIHYILIQINRNLPDYSTPNNIHQYENRNADNVIALWSRIRTTQINKLNLHHSQTFPFSINVIELIPSLYYNFLFMFYMEEDYLSIKNEIMLLRPITV